jgi:CRP-like cAMP-binding protein
MDVVFTDVCRMTLFRGFDEDLIRLLDLFFVSQNHPADTLVIEQGKMQNNFFLVVAGEMEVFDATSEKDIILGHVSAGQFVGEMNLFDPGIATASVRTLTPVQTLEISNDQFRYFMKAKPAQAADFLFQLGQTIVKRYRASRETWIEELITPESIRKADFLDAKKMLA